MNLFRILKRKDSITIIIDRYCLFHFSSFGVTNVPRKKRSPFFISIYSWKPWKDLVPGFKINQQKLLLWSVRQSPSRSFNLISEAISSFSVRLFVSTIWLGSSVQFWNNTWTFWFKCASSFMSSPIYFQNPRVWLDNVTNMSVTKWALASATIAMRCISETISRVD